MAGITALNKIKRQQAAFGGIMGRDGRRQYGGGSDMGQVADSSGKTGPGTGGYQGGPKGGMGDAGRTGPTNKNPYDKTPEQFKQIREKEKAKYEKQFGGVSPTGSRPMGLYDRIKTYNNNFQKRQNIKLAQKRAFQKYQDIEQYVDMMDDYGLTAEEIAEKVAANPSYGYDFSNLDLGKKTLGSNIGTNLEKYRTNLYDVQPKTKYSVTQAILDKLRPDTQVTAMNTLNKARDYNTLAMDPNISREKLEALANRGKTLDQINSPSGGGGGGNQAYLPFQQILPEEEAEEEANDFAYRFGTGQNVGADVLRGYVANGGRITRAGGGIMNAVPRQGYFLGKIVKGVGKAIGSVADAAGKVLKSDVGKMALLYGATAGLGSLAGGGGFSSLFKAGTYNPANFLGKKGYLATLGKKALLKDSSLGFTKGNLSLGKILGLSAALPFIPGINKAPENEDIGMTERGGGLIDPLTGQEGTPASMRANIENAKIEAGGDPVKLAALNQKYNNMLFTNLPYENYGLYANGGRIRAEEGGLMNLGGMEKDYRAEGGFVPIGKAEKADDVPARLSVNEFVFTADAVRNAGGGDIDKGAEVMENMMKNLENGGRVSEESQGNTGAQEMFSVSERIGEVI